MHLAPVMRAAALAVSFFIAACATKPAVLADFKDRPSTVNFTIVDARPDSDKTSDRLSPWITSCDYGIDVIGDEQTVPSKLVLLRHDLEDALGGRLRDATMTVTRYAVFYNNGKAMRAMVTGTYPGLAASLLTGAGDDCSKEKTTGGWYQASEVTTPFSPFIVELEATMSGKAYRVRIVFSTDKRYVGEGGPSEFFFDALRKADAALVEQLLQGS